MCGGTHTDAGYENESVRPSANAAEASSRSQWNSSSKLGHQSAIRRERRRTARDCNTSFVTPCDITADRVATSYGVRCERINMMAVEARPASAGAPEPEREEPRTLAARKAYPSPTYQTVPYDDKCKDEDVYDEFKVSKEGEEGEAPLDLTVPKVSVCEFARHPFTEAADFVRTQLILQQSQGFLATGRDSGTDSDDSAGRLSPDAQPQGKAAYKKSLIKRYSKSNLLRRKLFFGGFQWFFNSKINLIRIYNIPISFIRCYLIFVYLLELKIEHTIIRVLVKLKISERYKNNIESESATAA